jgi:hypothetical protein
MVFLKQSNAFLNEVYIWLHETGELQELASTFNEIKKLYKALQHATLGSKRKYCNEKSLFICWK